ncbi:DUF6777 domain-containing protein [Streptomyces sp. NPDC086549]|uniref:DUF6777 domain-containing protein n=1 Tax=Streptomyces sp. NPDC086549 TaxID=3365752 RepID=UPI0037F8ECE6
MWENAVRTPAGTTLVACVLSAALLVAGCARGGAGDTRPGGEVVLQPVAAQGPDPFTGSTATGTAAPAPVIRTPQPAGSAQNASVPLSGLRSISGGTPGLYGGTARVGSCDVERQIGYLAADPARGRAFARAEGVAQAAVPGFLRGLTPVVLRADTRVTNHGYRDGRAAGFPSVLQAGTAVLVDDRGVPRVRCACGNPLKSPQASHAASGTGGQPWSGYRPGEAIEVTPAPQAVTSITILDIGNHTWIERPIGHDVRHDHVVPPPASAAQSQHTQRPNPHETRPGATPGQTGRVPGTAPSALPAGCATPTPTVRPGVGGLGGLGGVAAPARPERPPADCATTTPATRAPGDPPAPAGRTAPDTGTPDQGAAMTIPQEPSFPDDPSLTEPGTALDTSSAETTGETGPETGPEAVPDVPDLPDGGGPIPDDSTSVTGSIFDSPTGVFGG